MQREGFLGLGGALQPIDEGHGVDGGRGPAIEVEMRGVRPGLRGARMVVHGDGDAARALLVGANHGDGPARGVVLAGDDLVVEVRRARGGAEAQVVGGT